MKRISFLLSLLLPLLPIAAHAQSCIMRNDTPTSIIDSDKGSSSCAAGDRYLRQKVVLEGGASATGAATVVPMSMATGLNGFAEGAVGWADLGSNTTTSLGTTTVINDTGIGGSAKVGDAVIFRTGTGVSDAWSIVTGVATDALTVSPAFGVAVPNGAVFRLLRPQPIVATRTASNNGSALMCAIDSNFAGSGATSILKLEDAAAASGDAGVQILGVANEAKNVNVSADGDYSAISTTKGGTVYATIHASAMPSSDLPGSILKKEDSASADVDAGVGVLSITQDPLSVDQSASGDYAVPKVDRAGRTITTLAPTGETFQACGTATATTSDVAIKAAVASNRIYVTSITCKNTSATVATSLDFKDATTVIAVGGISQMATASPGSFTATFPVPLKGSVNTALNFATNVSTSSVTCCAAGYISVQ